MTAYQETSTYEEYSESLVNASRFLHSCPNVHTRHRIARLNVNTPTLYGAHRASRAACSPIGIRHG